MPARAAASLPDCRAPVAACGRRTLRVQRLHLGQHALQLLATIDVLLAGCGSARRRQAAEAVAVGQALLASSCSPMSSNRRLYWPRSARLSATWCSVGRRGVRRGGLAPGRPALWRMPCSRPHRLLQDPSERCAAASLRHVWRGAAPRARGCRCAPSESCESALNNALATRAQGSWLRDAQLYLHSCTGRTASADNQALRSSCW